MPKSKFIIRRKDVLVDEVSLESEDLIIGRDMRSDVVLNHRAVSRQHAGISYGANLPDLAVTPQNAQRFWLTNLSSSNGTLLNGEAVTIVPLFDNDVIQIGPYLLRVDYAGDSLVLTVEMELKVQPLESRTAILQMPRGTSDKTQLIKMPAPGTRMTGLLSGIGSMTGFLPAQSQLALSVFWDKRKREAGKIEEVTPLLPRSGRRFGKAQFNWRPTFDLARVWRSAYFWWGCLVVLIGALGAAALYQPAFAPRPVSSAHAQTMTNDALLVRNIANHPNGNHCTSCHTPTAGMLDQCLGCHETKPTATKAAFAPSIYLQGHLDQKLRCNDCHTEHLGNDNAAGLLHYGLCYNCHNGQFQIPYDGKAGKAGTVLPIPHGGAVGYPKIKRGGKGSGYWSLSPLRWQGIVSRWRAKYPKRLLQTAEQYAAKDSLDQCHDLHFEGVQTNTQLCATCHFDKRGERDIRSDYGKFEAPKQACAKCHAEPIAATGLVRGLAKCDTCHQQHGKTSQLVALAPEDETQTIRYLAALRQNTKAVESFRLINSKASIGSASAIRHSADTPSWRNFGGLAWYAWLGLFAFLPLGGLLILGVDTIRRRYFWHPRNEVALPTQAKTAGLKLTTSQLKQKNEGPAFPRPVIDPLLCIGCHACVDACPHDVIAITKDGVAAPVNADQCMEDTSCQVECPTSPKACIVINTTKVIPERQVPKRDGRFMTNVPGIYLIGDVSGVPLIKNAINEGAQVIEAITQEISSTKDGQADYDVAIIGLGPAGLSATVSAGKAGLRYLALEQDSVAATIQNTYGKGKFVFFKPDSVETKGYLPLLPDPTQPAGNYKEPMLDGWLKTIKADNLKLNERESCRDIKAENGVFKITTEKGALKEITNYTARSIVLAIGNRGTPMLLKVPGEDLQLQRQMLAKFCNSCGTSRQANERFCTNCGKPITTKSLADSKVQYKLGDPKDYVGKKCIVVGAGNSAIEVAVALTGFERTGDSFKFNQGAEVTLLIRSDLKGDLKLGNKMDFFDCLDAGKIKAQYKTVIKQIETDGVTLTDARGEKDKGKIENDYIFALIGGDRPISFLKNLGIEITGSRKSQ